MNKILNAILNVFGVYIDTEINEPSSSVTTDPSTNQTLIKIKDYEYLINGPFQKEGAYPKKCDKDSVFEYITSHHLIKPFKFKLINWLKNNVNVEDHPASEQNLCLFIRNFHALNGEPVVVASIHSHDLLLVMVIEIKGYAKTERGMDHARTLVSAICTAEDMRYSGHVLFSHYRITENEKMVCSDFKEAGNNLYCFALKYE